MNEEDLLLLAFKYASVDSCVTLDEPGDQYTFTESKLIGFCVELLARHMPFEQPDAKDIAWAQSVCAAASKP